MSDKLTLNQSATVVAKVFSSLVEYAPEATHNAEEFGGNAYLASECSARGVNVEQLHEHHKVWAEAGLDDEVALGLVDKLRARLKVVGDAALQAHNLQNAPWRD